MPKVSIEVFFNSQRVVRRLFVIGSEAFSKDMCTLVMLMFESTFSEDFVYIFDLVYTVFFAREVIPNGIMFRGSGVNADDFTNE